MTATLGYAAQDAKTPLAPFSFERREVGPHDVLINIDYCGVCHSDIHQARNEWGFSTYPMVPGHEIVGHVSKVGEHVKKFKVGDTVGVGCFVDSCRTCPSCHEGLEQFCSQGMVQTYNGIEHDGVTKTFGGYSKHIVVKEDYVLSISPKLDLAKASPLLCAGITTYSPLRHWKAGPGKKVGVVGLGGLGHMAVKFARAFGAHVVLFTTSENKREDALKLGAHEVVLSKDAAQMEKISDSLDIIIDAVGGNHDVNPYIATLKRDGVMVMVGLPEEPLSVQTFGLVLPRRLLTGSAIGGIKETQEMLDYCAEHNIHPETEMIAMSDINHAYDRMLKNDVKYRFVIDMKTL